MIKNELLKNEFSDLSMRITSMSKIWDQSMKIDNTKGRSYNRHDSKSNRIGLRTTRSTTLNTYNNFSPRTFKSSDS